MGDDYDDDDDDTDDKGHASLCSQGSNSTNYIQNAFQLLLPVLQISHIQSQHRRVCTEPEAHTQH